MALLITSFSEVIIILTTLPLVREQFLSLELGDAVSVFNVPFTYVGRSEVTLDYHAKIFWLYNDDDEMLSVAPDDE